jgi:hypothetical protein
VQEGKLKKILLFLLTKFIVNKEAPDYLHDE